MRVGITILFFILAETIWGQQNPAAIDYFSGVTECAASAGGWKCLNLDLSSEIAGQSDSTKTYAYSWSFGDGTRIHGYTVEHCYEDFGSYQLTMDLIDAETNTVIRNELSATVQLYPEILPVIVSQSEGMPPTYMEFSGTYYGVEDFVPDRVYWRISDSFYEGNTIAHAFPVAGVYIVEMAMEKDMDFIGTITACATTEVTVKESDIWTTNIVRYFETARSGLQAGPFAAEDVACFIKSSNREDSSATILPLKTLMSELDFRQDEEYEIILFSGNLFTDSKRINLKDLRGNEVYQAMMDTVAAFVGRPLFFFRQLTMKGNNMNDPHKIAGLRETADLLIKHPHLQIEIGAYMHTGSRISRGIATSLSRSSAIKELLVGYGIAPERIKVASPEYNRALVNTCSAAVDCGSENKALDSKIEIKITGIAL